jgi:hypothetical protein
MASHDRSRHLQHLAIRAAFIMLASCALPQSSTATDEYAGLARVRSSDPAIAALITRAGRRSTTFQRLLAAIEQTNGIVQIEPGRCGHGVRACLKMWVGTAGPHRFLRVVIDRRPGDPDVGVMASMGHELQHAVEALSEPNVTDGVRLYHFFSRFAPTEGTRFETTAAIRTGDSVWAELRRDRNGAVE